MEARAAAEKVVQLRQVMADVAVIIADGELGEWELTSMGEEIFRLAHLGRRRVVLDLTRVLHVDYRALKPLAARARLLRAGGGDLKICGLSPYLGAIFRVAGVESEFEFHPDAACAHAAFCPDGLMSLTG